MPAAQAAKETVSTRRFSAATIAGPRANQNDKTNPPLPPAHHIDFAKTNPRRIRLGGHSNSAICFSCQGLFNLAVPASGGSQ